MNITIFIDSANDLRLANSLIGFAEGIKTHGDNVKIQRGYEKLNSDLNIIFGSWKNREVKHHVIKNKVVNENKPFVCLETPLLGRQKVEDVMSDNYFRVGFNGFLYDTGIFTIKNHSSMRWDKLKNEFGLNIKEWKQQDDYILIVLQIPGDASLKGENITKWAYEKCLEVRNITKKNIIIRTPQLDRIYDTRYINQIKNIKNVYLQKGTKENLNDTIDNAYSIITYSSGLAIESVMAGVPTIACSRSNFAYDICRNEIDYTLGQKKVNRTKFLSNLAYYQWNIDELIDGTCWLHMLDIIEEYKTKV